MDHAFEEGAQTESDCHEDVGGFESVHVGEEVSSQLHIVVVVESVAAEGAEHNSEHEEDSEGIPEFGGHAEAEHHIHCSTTEEGEVLEIVLEEQLEEDQLERVWSEVLAHFIVEEEVEEAMEDELQPQDQRDREDEEVKDTVQKDVAVPGFLHELLVGVGVVEVQIPHFPFDVFGISLKTDDLPLLLLDQADGLEYHSDDTIVFLLMVLV